MEYILGFVLKYLLNALKDWGVSLFKKKTKNKNISKDINKKRDRVIAAVKAPKKGVLMNDKQRKELYEAYADLASK